jgi:anaerobic ribonucleoside-triphosphate reductase activating protein
LKLNIHSKLWKSRANGPGLRTVVWFQGCSIGCKGCFNPSTHSFEPNQLIEPETLAGQIIQKSKETEGITISGGEPFAQAEGLMQLLQIVRHQSGLSVIVLSGYSHEQILKTPHHRIILDSIDVLIAGPYIEALSQPKNLAGSSNKTCHFVSNRYSMPDFEQVPDAEIIIDAHGNITKSGISPA